MTTDSPPPLLRSIAVYRGRALPVSETFIYDHLNQLSAFDARLISLKRVHGLELGRIPHYSAFSEDLSNWRYVVAKAFIQTTSIAKYLRNWMPDIIHAHFSTDAVDMLPFALNLKRPLVTTLHGFDITCSDWALMKSGPEKWIYLSRRRALFQGTHTFLAVSNFIKQKAISAGIPERKIKVHYLGINVDEFVPQNDDFSREGIIFVGRLVEKKGPHHLLKAVKLLYDSGIAVPVTLIGDGPLRTSLENMAAQMGINARFLGRQPKRKVIDELSRALVFCMPSIPAMTGDNEGLGLVYLEAQACQTPVVAYDQGPVPEAVKNGQTGLLAPLGEINILSKNLELLICNSDIRNSMGTKGRRFVEEFFRLDVRRDYLIKLYGDILENRDEI